MFSSRFSTIFKLRTRHELIIHMTASSSWSDERYQMVLMSPIFRASIDIFKQTIMMICSIWCQNWPTLVMQGYRNSSYRERKPVSLWCNELLRVPKEHAFWGWGRWVHAATEIESWSINVAFWQILTPNCCYYPFCTTNICNYYYC